MPNPLLPRAAAEELAIRLAEFRVVVVTGARQAGKTTLARDVGPGSRQYLSFDNVDSVQSLQRNPTGFLAQHDSWVLDEVQRYPDVLLAVKRMVDEAPHPRGRFLLTGSANLLLLRKVSESLAGRASYLTLWPMTRREQLGLGGVGVWRDLLTAPEDNWVDILESRAGAPDDWHDLAVRGGFPEPALGGESNPSRWFDGYVRSYLERDLRDFSRITALPEFLNVMRFTALRLGGVQNLTKIARDAQVPQSTVRRYLNLLETSYLLVRVPAWTVNRTRRMIKSPKLYWSDTGLALFLSGGPPNGAHLENLVLQDLLAWRDAAAIRMGVFHWRTTFGGAEVDFVVEDGDRLLPIEVKSTSNPGIRAAQHLHTFSLDYPNARAGLLLHTGDETRWLLPRVLSVPWWKVL